VSRARELDRPRQRLVLGLELHGERDAAADGEPPVEERVDTGDLAFHQRRQRFRVGADLGVEAPRAARNDRQMLAVDQQGPRRSAGVEHDRGALVGTQRRAAERAAREPAQHPVGG
jgi:hypothetical protein